MKWVKLLLALAFLAVISYASDHFYGWTGHGYNMSDGEKPNPRTKISAIKRDFNLERIANGRRLFLKLCFMCHGKKGEGDPNWKTPRKDGKYAAPPLNGTGHAWHHPMKFLHDHIKYGSVKSGGNMTGFEGALSDIEISDIIIWFQSKWPDRLYDSWYQRDLESRKANGGV